MAAWTEPVSGVELVDVVEIAARCHVRLDTVHQWRHRRRLCFPDPVLVVGDGSGVWRWDQVVDWLAESGRLHYLDPAAPRLKGGGRRGSP